MQPRYRKTLHSPALPHSRGHRQRGPDTRAQGPATRATAGNGNQF